MKENKDKELVNLTNQCDKIGVVFDYVIFQCNEETINIEMHRKAAIEAMKIIDNRLNQWALEHASDDIPFESFFRVSITEENLKGRRITYNEFWGNDDAFKKESAGGRSWSIPNADGYKTAFFNPPYDLRGKLEDQIETFDRINRALFGELSDENLEIYKWSDDWSNYFDAGKEWWGTFYWTVLSRETSKVIVIGGSSTD